MNNTQHKEIKEHSYNLCLMHLILLGIICTTVLCFRYRAFIFVLTFLLYASFHLSRKPISIVKVRNHKTLKSLVISVRN